MRFRIEITKRDDVWVADIFDLLDHGTDIAFASVSGPDLLVVMQHTSHYVFVAGADEVAWRNTSLPVLDDLVNDHEPCAEAGSCWSDRRPCM